ncbi:hypothetical protein BA768_10020 [Chryseobacterium sp. CBo1]|uniref:DUF6265 family protein n=1 Tax=Chryseobacterium sp. CBo1 TaxID=1869230 RepID=UPI00081050CD|nr:DUF6265 family protein [Chryseobacterium sp. CBo1]OCK52965.1 hypothetical protein BA768_10020 [Chryseobacterium sp. CBo1]
MKTKIVKISLVGAFIMLCSCTSKNLHSIERVEWLIGTWEHRTSQGSIYEVWKKVDGKELKGKSYMIKNNDTIVFETLRLVQENGILSYIPIVKDQNGGTPVHFKERAMSENHMVFENTMHDFPQSISYLKISEDSLKAEISGIKNGKQERRYFPMRRIR